MIVARCWARTGPAARFAPTFSSPAERPRRAQHDGDRAGPTRSHQQPRNLDVEIPTITRPSVRLRASIAWIRDMSTGPWRWMHRVSDLRSGRDLDHEQQVVPAGRPRCNASTADPSHSSKTWDTTRFLGRMNQDKARELWSRLPRRSPARAGGEMQRGGGIRHEEEVRPRLGRGADCIETSTLPEARAPRPCRAPALPPTSGRPAWALQNERWRGRRCSPPVAVANRSWTMALWGFIRDDVDGLVEAFGASTPRSGPHPGPGVPSTLMPCNLSTVTRPSTGRSPEQDV